MIGYEIVGAGVHRIVVLNDWLCDTSTWNNTRDYLDKETFTWAFADLRGYGRSKQSEGEFTLEEAASDVLELADFLGWDRFSIIGHSMSTLVALHVAQQYPHHIGSVVVLTPPPPTGFGVDDVTLVFLQTVARGSDAVRLEAMRKNWGDRLSDGWTRFKIDRWRACADPEAVAAYVLMFARQGLPDPVSRISIPVLAITGEQDAEPMRRDTVTKLLTPLCEQLTVVSMETSGHYPMQESPPLLVATIERFLRV